jgi:hypothetical protein
LLEIYSRALKKRGKGKKKKEKKPPTNSSHPFLPFSKLAPSQLYLAFLLLKKLLKKLFTIKF